MKVTKKAINQALAGISDVLHNSHGAAQAVNIEDLTVSGTRLYNRGPGPAWTADYSVYYRGQKMMGGDRSQVVDNIYRALKDPEWFKEHCKKLWGDRLNA